MNGTEAPLGAGAKPPWYARPGVVLPAAAALLVLSVVLARTRVVGRAGDPRLTTHSSLPQGASLFHDLAGRLGWRVERRERREVPGGPALIHAVLDPAVPLRRAEAHDLLQRVRGGAALLLVLGPGAGALADSLGVRRDARDLYARPVLAEPAPERCPETGFFVPLWFDRAAHLYGLRWTRPRPDEIEELVTLGPPEGRDAGEGSGNGSGAGRRAIPAVVGFPFGRGRVVVASDPDFLRNDVLRACGYGLEVRAVRALEYLRDGGDRPRGTLVFDEYHQGFGDQPGTLRTVAAYLWDVPSGRVLFQAAAAGLVLLLAAAPRALPPRQLERVERRSPLEHVDALGRAYAQVGATRTAAAHLLRGVRRRTERAARRGGRALTDRDVLDRVEHAAPRLARDVALVRRALGERVSAKELEEVGAALSRIETTLTEG